MTAGLSPTPQTEAAARPTSSRPPVVLASIAADLVIVVAVAGFLLAD